MKHDTHERAATQDPKALLDLVTSVTAAPGHTRDIGTRVVTASRGFVEMAIDKHPGVLQAHGYFHGGVIAGLADHAAGGAITTALEPGRFAITINLQVSYLAPATGDTLIARALARQIGKSICVAQVDLFTTGNGNETHCALATVTLRPVDLPKPLETEPA